MPWILLSLLFFWCAYREVLASIVAPAGFDSPRPVSKSYLAIVLILAALLVGLGLGLINGVMIALAGIPPIVVTLATLSIYRGMVFVVSGGAGSPRMR